MLFLMYKTFYNTLLCTKGLDESVGGGNDDNNDVLIMWGFMESHPLCNQQKLMPHF